MVLEVDDTPVAFWGEVVVLEVGGTLFLVLGLVGRRVVRVAGGLGGAVVGGVGSRLEG